MARLSVNTWQIFYLCFSPPIPYINIHTYCFLYQYQIIGVLKARSEEMYNKGEKSRVESALE
ncbi:hypothetical protein VIBNISFn118_10017 [Vibrio nigripulchritudo SFn118]|nr:hypothetical protein VIBNISFn118_10017 [Vibrio nigripulchritudo SFn118]